MSLPSWIYSPATGKCYYKSSFAKGISGNIDDATRRCNVRAVLGWQPPHLRFAWPGMRHMTAGCVCSNCATACWWLGAALSQLAPSLTCYCVRCMLGCLQESHGGVLLKISSAAEDDFVRLNLLWTGFFGETCEGLAVAWQPRLKPC